MRPDALKYCTAALGFCAMFLSFVSCGSQFYKVSLSEDTDDRRSATERPEAPLGLHSERGWRVLPIAFTVDDRMTQAQRQGLLKAMTTWEKAVGKDLFQDLGIDSERNGDLFPTLYSSLNDFINGQYLNNEWRKTGKPREVLATTIWENDSLDPAAISTADIRFNSDFYLLGDSLNAVAEPERELADMESLALHELGHLLGLSHIPEEVDSTSIMNPSLFIGEGLVSRKVSAKDVERIQRIYGCSGDACNQNAAPTTAH